MKTYTVEVDEQGTKMWYINGLLHREDGPAMEYARGDKYWFMHGKLHREDGPAIEYHNGGKYWYLDGKMLPEQEFLARTTNTVISVIINGITYTAIKCGLK